MTPNGKPAIRLSLRAGERIFINGAVLRADRKVSLELLNDATFLLENHVLQPEDTTTPLRQLYFAAQMMLIEPAMREQAHSTFAQMMLIEPAMREQAHSTFAQMLKGMFSTFKDAEILNALKLVDELVHNGRIFEALKTIRAQYPREAELMGLESPVLPVAATRKSAEANP